MTAFGSHSAIAIVLKVTEVTVSQAEGQGRGGEGVLGGRHGRGL